MYHLVLTSKTCPIRSALDSPHSAISLLHPSLPNSYPRERAPTCHFGLEANSFCLSDFSGGVPVQPAEGNFTIAKCLTKKHDFIAFTFIGWF